jgi:FkbM family methyltransferase
MKILKKLNGLRKITRTLGLNPMIYKLVYGNNSYEEKFDSFFSSKIFPNNIVYDIGANIGHYAIIYSKLVGELGKVVAFEPSVKNFNLLKDHCKTAQYKNIVNVNAGLGATVSKLFLAQGEDEIGATSIMTQKEIGVGNWIDVLPIDEVVGEYGIPNAIKIDVEGFELEVLEGGSLTLGNPLVKVVGIEIHSEILNKRGIDNCHERIEQILKNHGYKIHYPDFSHIIGYR